VFDFMEPSRPKFTDKTWCGQIEVCNYDLICRYKALIYIPYNPKLLSIVHAFYFRIDTCPQFEDENLCEKVVAKIVYFYFPKFCKFDSWCLLSLRNRF
jgi:hypothetical protein